MVKETKEIETKETKNKETEAKEYREAMAGNTAFGTLQEAVPQRNYKDRLFRMIFKEKKDLLSLYNAINGTCYTREEDIEIVTLENAIYMNAKNDLAFLLDFELNLYEHQSTFSPNMPLRDLFYISRELQKLVKADELYRSRVVKIPTPRFLVLYNGTEKQPERQLLKLSDAFQKKTEEPELELKVTMLNINLGQNSELLEHCKKLKEYAMYVDKMRRYAKILPIEEAVERTVTECLEEDILQEFLVKYRKEAIMTSIFEYNEERAMKYIREDEYSKGVKAGEKAGIELGQKLGRSEGRKKGREEGTQQMAALTRKLIKDSRMEDLLKATEDEAFREKLYQEYGLQ